MVFGVAIIGVTSRYYDSLIKSKGVGASESATTL